MCTPDSLEQRIIELETRLAFQDDLLEQLNQIVIAQQGCLNHCIQRLDSAELLLRQLRDERQSPSIGNGQS